MWIPRTPDEETKWRAAAEKSARSHGLTIGLAAWGIAVLVLSSGWFVSFSSGLAIERNYGGSFWTRLLFFGLIGSPIVYFVWRIESRKALRKDLARTICPKCDTAAEDNAGTDCECGGTFVSAGSVRWVEN
jgi:hypothetical protein